MTSNNSANSTHSKSASRNTKRSVNPKTLPTILKKSTVKKYKTLTGYLAKLPGITDDAAVESVSIERLPIISEVAVSEEPQLAITINNESLPRLPYHIVLRILKLAQVKYNKWPELILLRSLGEGWRLAIDNYHLPFCHKPSSSWNPYIFDSIPEDALSRNKGKCFKFPEDSSSFISMCQHSHNPFPTRELKIWCNDDMPYSVQESMASIAHHIWSFMYVIDSNIDSLSLLYAVLSKMPFLENLSVIVISPITTQDATNPPNLYLPASFKSRLVSLSVTGSTDSHILDNFLEVYGKGETLECLEVEGTAIHGSTIIGKDPHTYIGGIKKLKICGGSNEIFKKLNCYCMKWDLTHFTYHTTVIRRTSYISAMMQDWLDYFDNSLEELYLYWNNLENIGQPIRKVCPGSGEFNFSELRKLGLPYLFLEWECFDWRPFSEVEKIEYYDWTQTLGESQQLRNSDQIEDIDEITDDVGNHVFNIANMTSIQKIIVCFEKSTKNSIVAYGDDSSSDSDDDGDYY